MILTAEERAAALSGGDVDIPKARGAIKNKRWPGGVVVYQIDRSLGNVGNHSRLCMSGKQYCIIS